MADARSFFVLSSAGVPLTGGAAGMTAFAWDVTGHARGAPAITELGEGEYQIQPTDADEAIGTAVLVDTGAGNEPRRWVAACYLADNSNQFAALVVEDLAAGLWTGTAPTIGSYRSKAGGSRTPPALVALAGAYLFALVPSAADVTADVSFRVDGPVGSAQPYWSGSTEPIITGAALVNPTASVTGPVVALAVPTCSDFAWDLKTGLPKLYNHDLTPLSQVDALAQRLWLRITRIKGEHFLALDQGLTWLDWGSKPTNLVLIRQQIVAQAMDVLGVLAVTRCEPVVNSARQMTVTLAVQGATGPVTISV